MQSSPPERPGAGAPSSQDLPYGALPPRTERRWSGSGSSDSLPLEQLVDLSWLDPEPPVADPEPAQSSESTTHEVLPEPATGLSLTSPKHEADDDVHFGVAARALGVSRKTVERMVKRGQLERGPSNAPATVSKRALVAVLEGRRRDVSHLTRAAELEQTKSGDEWLTADTSRDPVAALREVLAPVLGPLLDEFVAVRTRAAVLESQLASIRSAADQQRARDELLLALVTRGWWGRRKTRKAVLRHYVLGADPAPQDPERE
jgi:hypothetical protein